MACNQETKLQQSKREKMQSQYLATFGVVDSIGIVVPTVCDIAPRGRAVEFGRGSTGGFYRCSWCFSGQVTFSGRGGGVRRRGIRFRLSDQVYIAFSILPYYICAD